MLVVWLVWITRIGWQTGVYLRQLPYMSTRFQQLSYRFLSLETILILIYVMVLSGVQVFFLLQTWYLMGYEPFIQSAVHTFAKSHSGRPSLGKLIFLSVYVYLVMFVHLPPESGDSMGLLATTAYHVEEKPRVDHYGFLTPDSHLFCVETATWLLEIAWQAYFDPPGRPSPSGYGELDLEPYGFDLVTHLRSSLTDTHVVVALNQDRTRLVVAFRGTTSRENWKSNLRFHQKVLWMKSRGRWRQRTCMEATKDFLSKIPLLNMALPRVHSGFWKAYASVRDELKEVTRLILDENPGVTVYVTGHSMGGALAILAAYDLAVNFSMKVNMYNFGGPRVGNPSFCRHYNKCVPTSYRVVMDGDIVPGVPKFWGLYQHVGTEISIDLEGNLIVDPSFVERHLHVSSKTKVATHPSSVYRASLTKCLEDLMTN
uniref:Fungal lipase-type domain-containing protein n=1 Tax=Globisporangium ultimum (strain ATCC 200006 / CBS 805.95 / DAOM BR144) TaxID=431595 RepID=K3WU34_GLOUD